MASPSTHQARNDLQPKKENERQDLGEDTDTSPHTNKNFNDSPHMDQESNNPPHLNGGLNESPQRDHDDVEDRPQSEDWSSDYLSSDDEWMYYWATEYAGHICNDDRGWRVLNPRSPPEPWWIEDPPSRSPMDPDYLCDVCRHINFCWLFENNMPKQTVPGERTISIGTVGRVLKQANCSFCVLLVSTFQGSEPKGRTVQLEIRCFSEHSYYDCNHPETEVKYLSVARAYLQVLDDSRPMRGRQISPYITQRQQNIARQWLEKCEHEHCNSEDADLVPNLALIDLNQRCIVRPNGPVRYAALSYVWGKAPQRMYSTRTRQEFETKGALHSRQGFLPRTITDAMDLAAHIGLDYLWVDSICILQDDEANRSYFISRMGTIYGAAAITIVDANGNHAGRGLVGMSSPRENHQMIATVQGMQLCPTVGSLDRPWGEYARCPWLQRGWTYQEMLLSQRLLLVTRAQLQFVCNHTVYVEETHQHSPRTSNWTMPAYGHVGLRRSEAAETPLLSLYNTAVEMFTNRNLTHESDVIPAFDAIFKALYKTEAKSLFNLPDVEIEEALLWESPFNFDVSSSSFSRMEMRRQPDRIPSWSWAGWRRGATYNEMERQPISAVLWRCMPTTAVEKRSELALQDYRCANWRGKGWKYRFLPDWGSHVYTHDSRPKVFFRNPIALGPHVGLHKPSFLDNSNVLHFSAFVAHISTSTIHGLLLTDRKWYSNTNRRQILDSSGFLAGTILLDYLPANEVGLRLVALARYSLADIKECERQLGIDLRNIAPLDWDPEYFNNISEPNDIEGPYAEYQTLEDWDQRRFQDKFYPLYKVLLVEMRDSIAYRIGIGGIHIDAFHAANPIWEEVRLG